MSLPSFTMRQLLEAGVHYGHTTRRWNPRMERYIFGARNGVHIINLEKTVPLLHEALKAVRDVVASGGRVLFVGTKKQASDPIREAAEKCGQYYINHRWLGGMMTNWKTVNQSIKRMKDLKEKLDNPSEGYKKKEVLGIQREYSKLNRAIGGIQDMGGLPSILFVLDTNKEHLAVQEAKRLGIPVVAVLDSNSCPEEIEYPIPGNDDALRAINLYCNLISEAVLDGLQKEMASAGVDIGEQVDLHEEIPEELEAEQTPVSAEKIDGAAATMTEASPVEKDKATSTEAQTANK